jgi:hypothetical protein
VGDPLAGRGGGGAPLRLAILVLAEVLRHLEWGTLWPAVAAARPVLAEVLRHLEWGTLWPAVAAAALR